MKFGDIKENQITAMYIYFVKYPTCILFALGRRWTKRQFMAAYVQSRLGVAR